MSFFGSKQPPTQAKQSSRFITAHAIERLEQIRERIVRDWERGISIQYLAKDYELTVRQAEYIVWNANRRPLSPTPITPAKPFIVTRRAA
jgi:hypothetical protein